MQQAAESFDQLLNRAIHSIALPLSGECGYVANNNMPGSLACMKKSDGSPVSSVSGAKSAITCGPGEAAHHD